MEKLKKKLSIRSMILTPMLAVNLLIVLIFIATISFSNIHFRMRQSAVSTLERVVRTRAGFLERTMSGMGDLALNMAADIEKSVEENMLDSHRVSEQMRQSPAVTSTVLSACLPGLMESARHNEATGMFVILDASGTQSSDAELLEENMAALYFIDRDTTSYNSDLSDLSLQIGPKQIARNISVNLSGDWSLEASGSMFSNTDFIEEPFRAARENVGVAIAQLGYWSRPVTLADGREVLYFSVPLRDADGEPYGIAGLELSMDILNERLSPAELGSEQAFYTISHITKDGLQPDELTGAGGLYGSYVSPETGEQNPLRDYSDQVWELVAESGQQVIYAWYPLDILASNNAYGQAPWVLAGGLESGELFQNVDNLSSFFALGSILAMAVGLLVSILSSELFVRPVTRLSRQLQGFNPDEEIRLDKTNIKEIDFLIDSIEELSADLAETGRRTIQTIEMTDMPIGFLEINQLRDRVYFTDYLFELFGLDKQDDSNFIAIEEWEWIYEQLSSNKEANMESVYLLDFVDQSPLRWLRIKMAANKDKTFGIIIDATDEILEKKRLEYERDTDPLTGLFNRHAFFSMSAERIRQNPDRLGVMLFADLDNLKYVNDTYGHDFGDRYIRAAARVFGYFTQHGGVVSRISGDEFAIFLYGYDSNEALIQVISETYSNMDTANIELPEGEVIKIRCSIGFSWFPQDSDNLEQLLRYADFAMYETKRSLKGSIQQFNIESYLKNSYLVEKNEEFNRFIEQNQVTYAFQPIVDIFSGSIFAYEALMRPEPPEFRTPYRVLQIARSQAKLYQIERMTFFNVIQWVAEHQVEMEGCNLFLNSIPNQMLSPKDLSELEARYSGIFSSTVIEITEDERSDQDFLREKIGTLRKMGFSLAIDDFGSGYSNEVILLNSNPNYLKIDMSLVKDIHKEENKRKLVENIISYAQPRGIKIIAEGIESYEEAETMIRLGADYLQGYYLAKPVFQLVQVPDNVVDEIRQLSAKYRDRRKDRR